MEDNFYHKTNESLRSLGEYVHVLVGLRTSFITIFLHQVMDSLNHS